MWIEEPSRIDFVKGIEKMQVALTDPLGQRINDLIEDHKKIEGEPLHLALRYEPEEDSKDIFLFEIIGDFGGGAIAEDREMMEVSFGSSDVFPLGKGQRVHLVLTNPQEFEVAMKEGWTSIQGMLDSIRSDRYQVLFLDKAGDTLLRTLRP